MFYVEGIVDSLEFEINRFNLKQFTLVPSSEFMITLPDGAKRVLFVDYCGKNDCQRNVASLAKAETNGTEKDIVCFETQGSFANALIDILVQAKHNRSKIRVCTGRSKDERNNAIPHPDLAHVVEIHLV